MYQLSATLVGHQSDVKDLSFFDSKSIVSVSRDSTCRTWNKVAQSNSWIPTIDYTADGYLNAVATDSHGTSYVGCIDGSIAVRGLSGFNKLEGHSKNVCAIAVKDNVVVSGSWDCTARVWINGVCKHVLKGHEASVWGVLPIDESTTITASADKSIRIWKDGKQVKQFVGHDDVVRSLCDLGNGMFVSCSNDGSIKQWTLEGDLVLEMHGHTSYVYQVAMTSSGELISCGEDRSVRVWKDGDCVQVITLPFTSVWTVDVDQSTGDFACGGSDYHIRVFSKDESRWASKDEIDALQEAVASSGIGKDQVGEVNKQDLKGPEVLKEPGTKEGQVVMIKNDEGSVEAHQWSSGIWIKIGEVVGSASSGPQKQEYQGKMYDYVFHVNIEDGQPELALPYNVTDNPYAAAQRFLEQNELPLTYLDEVARFIIKNSETVNLDSAPAEDPYGTRYTPAGAPPASAPAPAPPASSSRKIIPHGSYIKLTAFQPEPIINAITKSNDKQPVDQQLGKVELELLGQSLRSGVNSENAQGLFKNAVHMTQNWTADIQDILPALDLLRIAVAFHPNPPAAAVIQMIFSAMDPGVPKHALLATRSLVNLFGSPERNKLMNNPQVREQAFTVLRQLLDGPSPSKPLAIAAASLMLNYSVLTESNDDVAMAMYDNVGFFKDKCTVDPEATYRLLLAFGTLLVNNHGTVAAAKGFGLDQWVSSTSSQEPRFTELVKEIQTLL